jgi:hypothetical protein
MDDLKGFLTQMIFRWLLKIVGGYFAINGVLNPDLTDALTQLAAGVSAILIGVIISITQHKKALDQVPEHAS